MDSLKVIIFLSCFLCTQAAIFRGITKTLPDVLADNISFQISNATISVEYDNQIFTQANFADNFGFVITTTDVIKVTISHPQYLTSSFELQSIRNNFNYIFYLVTPYVAARETLVVTWQASANFTVEVRPPVQCPNTQCYQLYYSPGSGPAWVGFLSTAPPVRGTSHIIAKGTSFSVPNVDLTVQIYSGSGQLYYTSQPRSVDLGVNNTWWAGSYMSCAWGSSYYPVNRMSLPLDPSSECGYVPSLLQGRVFNSNSGAVYPNVSMTFKYDNAGYPDVFATTNINGAYSANILLNASYTVSLCSSSVNEYISLSTTTKDFTVYCMEPPSTSSSSSSTTSSTIGLVLVTSGILPDLNDTGSSTSSNAIDTIESNQSPNNIGLIVGISVGVLVVLAILILVVFFVLRRKQVRDVESNNNNNNNNNNVELKTSHNIPMLTHVKIYERLGGGNFGDVYRGEWKGAQVALKSLKAKEHIVEFEREAQLLFKLSHPHCIQFLGMYVAPNNEKYIVTEFMSKGNLLDLLKFDETVIPNDTLIDMARQASAGMAYLEGQKIVHRDLSLRNLLVTSTSESTYIIKVADFGMSRAFSENYYQKETSQLPVKWSSPEAIQYGKFSSKSDVWSFGVVLFELFSRGMVPYYGMNNNEVTDKVIEGYRLPKPKECPDRIYSLMLKCWSLEANARPTFEAILEELTTLSPTGNYALTTIKLKPSSVEMGVYN